MEYGNMEYGNMEYGNMEYGKEETNNELPLIFRRGEENIKTLEGCPNYNDLSNEFRC